MPPPDGLGPSRREILPWSIIAVVFSLGLAGLLFTPVTGPLGGRPEDALEIEGRLFPPGGGEGTSFKGRKSAAAAVCRALLSTASAGRPAAAGTPGTLPAGASFRIRYRGGETDFVEIAPSGELRLNGKPFPAAAAAVLAIILPLAGDR